jgi:hypothetical protein
MHTIFWSENLKERNHLEDLEVDDKEIAECILGNRLRSCGVDACGSGQVPVAGCCEHGNEHSDSIKGW